MDPEEIRPAPEPERPSAMALAMAKAQEDAANAKPFLEAACCAKTSYSTEDAAGRAIVRIRGESPGIAVQHAYPCGVCKGWHLTSLDAERSDLARQIVESRRPEKPLPMDKQTEIVARYRRGVSLDDLALDFGFPRRAIVNVLNAAGYAISIVQEQHRREGLSE
jgi:hypothetical protein